jgi:tRNA(Ile2) C34 agmatinyltransferase TiaS
MCQKMIFIGLDDTDNPQSRGTGRLARQIAAELVKDYPLLGVTRHQLLFDPRVPYTSHNSSAAIHLQTNGTTDLGNIFERVKEMMLADFQVGSDPGLCIANSKTAGQLKSFGLLAKRQIVTQQEAKKIAADQNILLEGLDGTKDGLIGALAAVGLAASGEDGRYLLVGNSRQLSGLQPVSAVLEAGITSVRTLQGQLVENGLILSDKLRPARRAGRPILFVEENGNHWLPLKLD